MNFDPDFVKAAKSAPELKYSCAALQHWKGSIGPSKLYADETWHRILQGTSEIAPRVSVTPGVLSE